MSSYSEKISRIREQLLSEDAAGAVLSTPDNIFYASGFSSVMDGWHLAEPISAVFVPTDAASPVLSAQQPATAALRRARLRATH